MKNKIIYLALIICALPLIASGAPTISQGDIVYVNDTIDISTVVPPYPYLAYWDGYNMYDSNATYIIGMPQQREKYYNFYIDPSIFLNRTGLWYKYSGTFESNANNIAFVVKSPEYKNSTMRYQNGTLINVSIAIDDLNQTLLDQNVTAAPPVPIRHISDYLIARGDSWNMTVNETTNIWLFGNNDQLLDMSSVNTSIDISADILSHFKPGNYKLVVQTIQNGSNDFTVKYDPLTYSIKWFDPTLFVVHSENIYGYSPQVVMETFKRIIPLSHDDFKIYNFTLQDPSIEITSIKEVLSPNETINEAGFAEYNTNSSFVVVKGYTNVAPGSLLTFILDEKQQTSRTIKSHTGLTTAGGSYGGDYRWFQAIVPVDKYGLALGEHIITGYNNLSRSGATASFTLYDTPPDSYVPSKEVRYISGKYGAEEFVPTPTPIIIHEVKEVPTIVIQTVTIPVTPSTEVVKEQQQKALDEKVNTFLKIVGVGTVLIIIILWGISLYLRRRDME